MHNSTHLSGRWLTILFISFFLAACAKNREETETIKPAVSVYSIAADDVGQYFEFVARTEASQSAEIRARIEGVLIARNFIEGRFVKKDQTLFEIDPDQFKASLSQAEADLKGQVVGAENARRNLARGEELNETGFISQSDLDKLHTTSSQADAGVKSAQANMEKATLNLDYTKIRAPFDGMIGKVNYDVGSLVGPQTDILATIIAIDPIYTTFQLEEARFLDYQQRLDNPEDNADFSLRLPNNTVYSEQGIVNFADTSIDGSTGTVGIRAEFPNPNGTLLPGLFVTLIAESKKKVVMSLVPQLAVQENQQGKFVLVVEDDGSVTRRIVTLERRINAMWVVESGLTEGERVIIEGLQKVKPGIFVTPVNKAVDRLSGTITDMLDNE